MAGWGWLSAREIPLDAIPDLSDVQVIIRTEFPGQSPQVVEQQVTYPITTTMLAVPGAQTVRGYSFFGDSYVYVIFADGTDLNVVIGGFKGDEGVVLISDAQADAITVIARSN